MFSLLNCTKHPRKITFLYKFLHFHFLEAFLNPFNEANITLISKSDKDITKNLQTNSPHDHRFKYP